MPAITTTRRVFTTLAASEKADGVALHAPSTRALLASLPNAIPLGRAYLSDLSIARGGLALDGHAKHHAKKAAVDEGFSVPTNITADNLDEFSLYDVLGIGNNTSAGMDIITKAYRKAVLQYHPDKQVVVTATGHEDDQTIFLKIQLAVATLSDKGRRRAYDSQLDFDETIPSQKEAKAASAKGTAAFIELYKPIFELNAKFASVEPVPSFGEEDTPINEVHLFYSYWVKFDSWRDFSATNMEHNPADAGDRHERRWMEKENAVVARKLKKKEMGRINDLVMFALENDPRILADKAAAQKAKDDKKAARFAEANREANEKLAAEAKALEDKANEKVNAKAAKEEKERIRKWHARIRSAFRKSLRTMATEAGTDLSTGCEYGELDYTHVEAIAVNYEPNRLMLLVEGLGADMKLMRIEGQTIPAPMTVEEGVQKVKDAIAEEAAAKK
jgi:DnaJ family protein C protein 2